LISETRKANNSYPLDWRSGAVLSSARFVLHIPLASSLTISRHVNFSFEEIIIRKYPELKNEKDINQRKGVPCIMENVPSGPYPELPAILTEFVSSVKNDLDKNLIGVYLVGSLAIGDFDLDSDIDFLVVIKEDLTNEAVLSLQEIHSRIYRIGCYPAQHLEGSYITYDLLNQPEDVGVQPLWYLDNGSTTFERATHDNQWHVRWVLRERGITLLGPKANSLLPPIPINALRSEVISLMQKIADTFAAEIHDPLTFLNSRFGQSFAVLSYCRMLHTLKTDTVQSKFAGMKWALQALDSRWAGFIQQAWEERKGVRHMVKIRQPAQQSALEETMAFIKYAIHEIDHF